MLQSSREVLTYHKRGVWREKGTRTTSLTGKIYLHISMGVFLQECPDWTNFTTTFYLIVEPKCAKVTATLPTSDERHKFLGIKPVKFYSQKLV